MSSSQIKKKRHAEHEIKNTQKIEFHYPLVHNETEIKIVGL